MLPRKKKPVKSSVNRKTSIKLNGFGSIKINLNGLNKFLVKPKSCKLVKKSNQKKK